MAPSPRKRMPSPRKRLPPAPFSQTWHETDAAHLDPNALPVARIPRGWERKRQVKQVGDGKEKSIWRRFSLRSSIAEAVDQDETEEDEHEHDAQSRAVKRRQRLSPKAMEKMQGNKRAFKGTRWDRRKSVLPRKRSAHPTETLHEEQSDSDDTQDATDADMSHESLAEPPHEHDGPTSFSFAMEAAHTVDQLPDYESVDEREDEQDDDQKLGNILPEDSTFALIFRSPTKSTSAPLSTSPAKVHYPALPPSDQETEEVPASEAVTSEVVTVTGPTVESVVAEVIAAIRTTATYISTENKDLDVETANTIETTHQESPNAQLEDADEIAYPALPPVEFEEAQSEGIEHALSEDEDVDADMSEIQLDIRSASIQPGETSRAARETPLHQDSADQEFTEASMQLNILEDYEREGELASQPPTPKPAEERMPDITDGLTLSFTPAKAASREHTPKRLHSPPPPLRIDSGPDDATMTVAIDDDTAILKGFLSRAAASKAERSAIITRRESLENRRDSDIVRHALASPRKALEEKDPNSPSKVDSESTFDLATTPVLSPGIDESASPTPEQLDVQDGTDAKTGRGSRRSSRAKKSRLPAPATTTQPQASNKIAIRRADGDPVVLKKTDAQELALITKNNTRKNKQGAFMVSLRLLKLQAEAILSPSTPLDDETPRDPVPGRRGIRWDETLAYYQEHADTIAAQQAEAESLATPDELSIPVAVTKKTKAKPPTDKNSTPKIRRVRGLGTANGTPGKGLLSTGSLLPDAVQEEQAAAAAPSAPAPAAKGIPKPRVVKKLPVASAPADSKLATLEVTPIGVEPTKERKSRLATPKSVRLPKPVAAAPVAAAEKENTRTGISGATPRKGIPAPKIVAPKTMVPPTAVGSVGVESGLPRRRGRKV
ncbi:hypothetical protein N0V95_007786 [Ascochyta clinopodiicola]|nr:hypothetical protein N0V95_007786 [Ascochyta clinopodiicola]